MVVPIPNPQRPVGTKQRFPGSPGLGELCFAQEIFLLDSGVHFIDASLRAQRFLMGCLLHSRTRLWIDREAVFLECCE